MTRRRRSPSYAFAILLCALQLAGPVVLSIVLGVRGTGNTTVTLTPPIRGLQSAREVPLVGIAAPMAVFLAVTTLLVVAERPEWRNLARTCESTAYTLIGVLAQLLAGRSIEIDQIVLVVGASQMAELVQTEPVLRALPVLIPIGFGLKHSQIDATGWVALGVYATVYSGAMAVRLAIENNNTPAAMLRHRFAASSVCGIALSVICLIRALIQ